MRESKSQVTVERLERAIRAVAGWMIQYDLPQVLPTLKRLQAERDRLLKEGNPIEYAKRVLDLMIAGPKGGPSSDMQGYEG